jgi:hypothetical protein
MFRVRAHGPHEACTPFILQRKDSEEVSRVQRGMDLAVHCRAARFHISNVKKMAVGAAREADRQSLPDGRMCAVAAGDIRDFTSFSRSIAPLESDEHTTGRLLERHKFCLALNFDAGLGQTID